MNIEIDILLMIQNFREATGGVLTDFMNFVSSMAINYFIVVPALIIYWCYDKKIASKLLLSHGASILTGAFLKVSFCRYRPMIEDSRIVPDSSALKDATGYSFPSGHCCSSGGFWNGLLFTFKKYKGIVIYSIVAMLVTMFSRLYLGCHYPSDVIIGALVSLIVAYGVCKLIDHLDKYPSRDVVVLLVGTIICIALLIYTCLKGYPMDYDSAGNLIVDPTKLTIDGFKDPGRFYGILLGWFIERRFIKFDTSGTLSQKALRALVGGVLVVLWWTTIANPIGKAANTGIIYFIMQASTPLLFMTVYPLIFKMIETRKNV